MYDRRSVLAVPVVAAVAGLSGTASQARPQPETDQWGEPVYLYPFEDMIARLEDPARAEWQQPERLVSMLQPLAGKTVYDLGAGTGYLAFRIVGVGAAKVIAADPDRRFLSYALGKRDALGINRLRLEARPIPYDDPLMSAGEADWITCVNTWHQVQSRVEYLAKLRRGLKRDGRLLLVNHQKRETPYGPPARLRLSPEDTVAELREAGFSIVSEDRDFSPINYVIIGRPA